MGQVTIDFVTEDQANGRWNLILVEEGPWEDDEITSQLRRVQGRLYGCLDAILDGQIAKAYPDSVNKPIEIRVDAYNVPRPQFSTFFEAFAAKVLEVPDYKLALEKNDLIPSISFCLEFGEIS